MARTTSFLVYLEEQCVAVAVKICLAYELSIAAGVALAPQFITAATEIHHATFSKSHTQRLGVHPCHHQDVARIHALRNCRYQTISVIGHAGQLIGGGKNDAPP